MRILKQTVSLLLIAAILCSCLSFMGLNASALSPLPHLLQADEPWGSYLVGGATIARTGCGILSLVNCVGYLTGKSMDIIECAEWAYSVKGFNNYSNNLGTYRLVLYPKVQAKYGEEYGFTVDCNTGDSGWWVSDASSKVLKNHLANGGVAIGMIPGHFIAMVDYDATTNKFHVLDSAPAAYRGTSSNRGDVWLSESHFTEAAGYSYQLQWFCLLSATGTPADEQDNEKEYLENAIAKAETARYNNYNESALNSLRSAYNSALTVLNSSSSTSENYKAAREALESAIEFTSSVSVGKSYTATATNRGDDYDDDGKKLTDGKKGSNAPDTSDYAGWKNKTEIVIDLGEAKSTNYYNVYLAGGDWGIEVPENGEFNVTVSSSANGTSFTDVASSSALVKTKANGAWEMLKVTAVSESDITARYIKFTITCTAHNNYIWIDEVEACSGDLLLDNGAYISKINKKLDSGDCIVFTPDFGTITTATANHTNGKNILVKWDSTKNAYVVSKISDGVANLPAELTLASDELLISAHDWETGVSSDPIEGSAVNTNYIASASVGAVVSFNGVDFTNNKLAPASYLTIEGAQSSEPTNPSNPTTGNIALGKDYEGKGYVISQGNWPASYNASLTDGVAHTAITYDDNWFGFCNVEGDNGYVNAPNKVGSVIIDLGKSYDMTSFKVNTFVGDESGITKPKSISVYVSDTKDGTYTYVGDATMGTSATDVAWAVLVADATGRYVKVQVELDGSFAFINEIEVYGEEASSQPPSVDGDTILGDTNGNGNLDPMDYTLARRAYFGSYAVDSSVASRIDMNKNGIFDPMDCTLLRRVYFGTYNIG